MHQAIFPKPDQELADASRGLDGQARQAGFRFNGWDGYEDVGFGIGLPTLNAGEIDEAVVSEAS